MTTTIPQLTQGWRLRMAREQAGLDVSEMADLMEVSRDTIYRWEHDRVDKMKQRDLRDWAEITSVPLEWLAGDLKVRAAGSFSRHVSAGRGHVTDNNNYEDIGSGPVFIGAVGPVSPSTERDMSSYREYGFCHSRRQNMHNQSQLFPNANLTAGKKCRSQRCRPR